MTEYYCFECNKYHRRTSKIGIRHAKHEFKECMDCGEKTKGYSRWYWATEASGTPGAVLCVNCHDKRKAKEIERKMETFEEHECFICGKKGKYYPELGEFSRRHEVNPHTRWDGRGRPKGKVFVCAHNPNSPLDVVFDAKTLEVVQQSCESLMDSIDREEGRDRAYLRQKRTEHEDRMRDMKEPFIRAICDPLRKWADKLGMFSFDLESRLLGEERLTFALQPSFGMSGIVMQNGVYSHMHRYGRVRCR